MRIVATQADVFFDEEIELKPFNSRSNTSENIRNIAKYFEENSEKITENIAKYYYATVEIIFEVGKEPKIKIKMNKRG